MGIPGVFAGYSLGPGLHWSRKYRVWALCDWLKQSLAYDAEKPIRKLRTPHYTERVELKEPLEFPCKIEYEKINVTIEGLKEKDRLDGSAEKIPPPIDDHDEDDDGDEGGDGDGRPPSKKVPQKGIEGEPSLDDIEKELFPGEEPIRPGPPGIDKPAHPDLKIPEGGPEHYSMGTAGDGVVYLNDDGEWVKINSRGHPYRIDERGFRRISGTPRPSRYTPTEWQKMAPDVRKGIAKAEEKKAEADLERKKSEARIKESEDRKKAKEKKKAEKEEKRSSGSSKRKDDHPASVAKSQDHICRGKVFQYGRKHFTSTGSGASVMSDSSDTDVPADDDFIVEWDEWFEVENGRGPKATWHDVHVYDFTQGKEQCGNNIVIRKYGN
eukprot:s243_g29.t1